MREEDLLERVEATEARLARLQAERDAATSAIGRVAELFFNHCMMEVSLELEKWRGQQGEGRP